VTVTAKPGKIGPEFAFHSPYFHKGEGDVLECPIGGTLAGSFDRVKDGIPVPVFRCQDHCLCPHAAQCSGRSKVRTVDVSIHWDAIAAQHRHLQTEAGQKASRLRKQIVEPYFGWAKRTMAVRRLEDRGLAAIDTFWKMLGTTRNLGFLYRSRVRAPAG
jgi:hypothetical protein